MTESIVKLLQLAPRVLFALWTFGAIVLFLPDGMAGRLALAAFRDAHRFWIGPGTLAAFVLWASHATTAIRRWWRDRRALAGHKERVLAKLDNLSDEELRVFGYFLYKGAPTQFLWLNLPPATSLCAKGLLEQATDVGIMFSWPFTIPDFVWEELILRAPTMFPDLRGAEAQGFFGKFDDYQRQLTLGL